MEIKILQDIQVDENRRVQVSILNGWFKTNEDLKYGNFFLFNGDIFHLVNGQIHREDGPAIIQNNFTVVKYCQFGMIHRLNGPAWIHYETQGEFIDGHFFPKSPPIKERYLINDQIVLNDEFGRHPLVLEYRRTQLQAKIRSL